MLQNGLYLPLVMLGVAGVIPAETAGPLSLITLLLIFVYGCFIAKVALDVGAGTAVALVAFDFVLSVFIGIVASSML